MARSDEQEGEFIPGRLLGRVRRALRVRAIHLCLLLPVGLCACGPAAISTLLSSSSSGGGSGGGAPDPADTVAPDTFLAPGSVPAPAVPVNAFVFEFSASEVDARFEASLDQGAWSTVTSPHAVSGLSEGLHEFRVRAIDLADNADPTPAVASWTVDLTPPVSQILTAPAVLTAEADAAFTFTANEAVATWEARVDGGPWQVAASPLSVLALADGPHSFELRALDLAGNVELNPRRHDWEIDRTPPSVAIDFPPLASLTDATTFILRGRATDANGVDTVELGTIPAMTFDDFAHWELTTPLALGANPLDVASEDSLGNLGSLVATPSILRAPVIDEPVAAARGTGGEVWIVDRASKALLRAEITPGGGPPTATDWSVVSGPNAGAGPPLDDALAVAFDPSHSRVLVTLGSGNALVAIDLTTGDRSVIASDTVGNGPSLAQPWTLAVSAGGTFALVGRVAPASLVSVDLSSGNRSLVAGAGVGGGPPLQVPRGLSLDESTGRAFWLDGGSNSLLAIALVDGSRVEVSGPSQGTGPSITAATALGVDLTAGRAFVAQGAGGGVLEIDLVTGTRASLTGPTPTDLPAPTAIVPLNPTDTVLRVLDERVDGWVEVDRVTGALTLGARSALGSGSPFLAPIAAAVTDAAVWVVDRDRASVVTVDRATGDRSELSGPTRGAGLPFAQPEDLAVIDPARLVIADSGVDALIEVDLATGDRDELSGPNRGSGPALSNPTALALDPALARVLVVDAGTTTLLEIDLVTGDRSILSGSGFGGGPAFSSPRDVAVRGDGVIAYVLDRDLAVVIEVELATGFRTVLPALGAPLQLPARMSLDASHERMAIGSAATATIYSLNLQSGFVSVISGPSVGDGPPLRAPAGLAWDEATATVWVAEAGRSAVFAIDPARGTRVTSSK